MPFFSICSLIPAADVFPMLADDEMAELAGDIATNGLNEPLVTAEIDGEVMLVDGRNRRAACQIAGVTPTARLLLNGEDPTAYVISANINRRHMTTGQRAMAVAMIYPKPEQGKRTDLTGSGEVRQISQQRLADARTVLKYASDLADNVLNGSVTLDFAHQDARRRKGLALSGEARLAGLRSRHPGLADKVVERAS